MFERFTDQARRIVALAQEEARTLNHNDIGTEDILLALIHERNLSDRRRRQPVPAGPAARWKGGHLPWRDPSSDR